MTGLTREYWREQTRKRKAAQVERDQDLKRRLEAGLRPRAEDESHLPRLLQGGAPKKRRAPKKRPRGWLASKRARRRMAKASRQKNRRRSVA